MIVTTIIWSVILGSPYAATIRQIKRGNKIIEKIRDLNTLSVFNDQLFLRIYYLVCQMENIYNTDPDAIIAGYSVTDIIEPDQLADIGITFYMSQKYFEDIVPGVRLKLDNQITKDNSISGLSKPKVIISLLATYDETYFYFNT